MHPKKISGMLAGLAEQTRHLPLTGELQFHVIHDLHEEAVRVLEVPPRIRLHRIRRSMLPPVPMPPMDARWRAFREVVRRERLRAEDCAFAVDISDTNVVGNVSALCERHPAALLAASDVCSARSSKLWLAKQAKLAGYNMSAGLHDFLLGSGRFLPLHNSGVLGGRLPVFKRLLGAMVSSVERHHLAREAAASGGGGGGGGVLSPSSPPRSGIPVDMLSLNAIAVGWNGSIVSGYPRGAVSLPMWGNLCASSQVTGRSGSGAELLERLGLGLNSSGLNCTFNGATAVWAASATDRQRGGVGGLLRGWPAVTACARSTINAMLPGYYFAHKLPWVTTSHVRCRTRREGCPARMG